MAADRDQRYSRRDHGIDFTDIQGIARFGHGHLPESNFLLLGIRERESARAWLRAAPLTTAERRSGPPERALQLAFTAAGLRAIGLEDEILAGFSDEFLAGMAGDANRSRRLGDRGGNDPANWAWGGPTSAAPHLALLLYAGDGGLGVWQAELLTEEFAGAFEVLGELPAVMRSDREPFGFADGISQPEVDWWEEVATGVHERAGYSNFLAAGEVLLGYRNEYGLYTNRPLLDPARCERAEMLPAAADQPDLRDLGRNGSYLVLRQLGQDVAGFWQFLDHAAEGDAAQRESLAALMVGRQRDGTPLMPAAGRNGFDFDRDPLGRRCPLGAHVRRANPRSGDFPPGADSLLWRLLRMLGFPRRHLREDLVASTRFHRLLRRGRAYGDELTPEQALLAIPGQGERGLHFACLGANIARQFEFVQNAWIASAHFAGLDSEADPLLGSREPGPGGFSTDRFSMPRADGPARCLSGLPQFVRVLGGAYFFLPGIKALQFIVRERT